MVWTMGERTTKFRGGHRRCWPLRAALRVGVVGVAVAGVAAATATAAPLIMEGSDPVDQVDGAVDLTAAHVEQDPITGAYTAHIELAASAAADPSAMLRVIVGGVSPNGQCMVVSGAEFVTVVRLGDPAAVWTLGVRYPTWVPAVVAAHGSAVDVTVATDGRLQRRVGTCAAVSTGRSSVWPDALFAETDGVMAVARLAPTVVNGQVAPGTTVDQDRDGVADRTDRCVNDPGLRADGCPDVPGGRSLRLGARRLVVARLMPKVDAAAACPKLTTVVVSQNHRLGAAKLPTVTEGSMCAVRGVVRLKRHRGAAAVMVRMRGTGLVPLAQRLTA
jgi:hypothetical protein